MLWAVCACSTKIERREEVAETEAVVEEVVEPETVDPFWRDTLYLDSISTDTLVPSHRWAFNISDGSFPCDTVSGDFLMGQRETLRGIESDGNGNFWFMGDAPAKIAFFQGSELKWTRETDVNMNYSYCALFKLIGDSIWFVDEFYNNIYRMSKDGKGAIDRFELPLKVPDKIDDGYFTDSMLYFRTSSEMYLADSINQKYTYDVHHFRIALRDCKVESITLEEYLTPIGYMQSPNDNPPYYFANHGKGYISGARVFNAQFLPYDAQTVSLQFGNGQRVRDIKLEDSGCYECFTGFKEDCCGDMQSANTNILRGGKLYTGGIDFLSSSTYPRVFYLLEYDIDAYVKELLRRSDERAEKKSKGK